MIKMESIIAIDAGTTSSRTIAFNKKIEQLAISQFEFTQIFPKKVGLSMIQTKYGRPN